MTRLDQALRWWVNHDEALVPARHLDVMKEDDLVEEVEDGPCFTYAVLTEKGKKVFKAYERRR